jgi:cytochrome c oxidase assembly protein subunit 15
MRYHKNLHRFAIFTACCTFLLLIAGGLVTSTGSGLAVPDWPNTYGENMFLFPVEKWIGGILFEHGHRLFASFVGFLTIILSVWIWNTEYNFLVKKLGTAALIVVIVQGIFGGITVLFYLPQFVSAFHATLAQTFFCIVVSIALFTSPKWQYEPEDAEHRASLSFQRTSLFITISIFAQLIFGALLRHNDTLVSVYLFLHILGASVVSYLIIKYTYHFKKNTSQKTILRLIQSLQHLLWFQLSIGTASFVLKYFSLDSVNTNWTMVIVTVLHLAIGAGMLAISLTLTLYVRKYSQSIQQMTHNIVFAKS